MSIYTTVDSIVKDVLIDLGEETEHLYLKFLHWGLKAAKENAYDCSKEIKTVRLTMSPAKTVDLPLDYINYVKVGIVVGDKLKTFLVNDNLEKRTDVDECGNALPRETSSSLNSLSNHSFFGHGYLFSNYNGYGNGIWGYGGSCGNIGHCSIDREHDQIQFSSEVTTTDICLEYITNGIDMTGETTVHQFAEDMIRLYIHWQRKKFSEKYGMNQVQISENEFYRAKRILIARMNPFSIKDFIHATRKGAMDRMNSPGHFTPEKQKTTAAVIETCSDVFPIQESDTAPDGFKKIYWGSKANPLVDTDEEILTLESEFFEDRLITKTFNATGGRYLYFAYPVSYGASLGFIFNTFLSTFTQTTVIGFTDTYGTEDYYVYRSNQLQNGDNLTVEIT